MLGIQSLVVDNAYHAWMEWFTDSENFFLTLAELQKLVDVAMLSLIRFAGIPIFIGLSKLIDLLVQAFNVFDKWT